MAGCAESPVSPTKNAPEFSTGISSTITVSNLIVASGRAYEVRPGAVTEGEVYYVDRSFELRPGIPSQVEGATYIRTANNDKNHSAGSTDFLRFDIDQDAVVYVAHDNRLARPEWLRSSFEDTGVDLQTSDRPLRLFRRSYSAGTVTLGSNVDSAPFGSMYLVLVKPTGSDPTPPPSISISNLSVASGSAYEVRPGAVAEGEVYYIDRAFELRSEIPAQVEGATYIRTANGDKNHSAGSTDFLRFDIDQDAVVYVAHDNRLQRPSWLSSTFEDTGTDVTTSDTPLRLFRRSFPRGRVTLGSNVSSSQGGSMYVVIVEAVVGGDPSPPPPPPGAPRVGQYVSVDGSSGGDGSWERPWDLSTALAHPAAVEPGDTIWLRGGTYRGCYTSRLSGSSGSPIVVRQYPGERATIDGQGCANETFIVGGSWTYYWGFEVMNSDPDRFNARKAGVRVNSAPNTKFINLVVRDSGNGFAFWSQARDSEIYGAILYNNGWQGVRGHGHGIYTQNSAGVKVIEDVISFNNFSTGMKAYGSGNAFVRGYRFLGNVAFNAGSISTTGKEWNILIGQESGGNGLSDIVASQNVAWHSEAITRSFNLGYNSVNEDVVAEGNYVTGPFDVWQFRSATVRNNTVYSATSRVMELRLASGQSTSGYGFGGNQYFGGSTSTPFRYAGQNLTFANWRSTTGLDAGSSHTSSQPTGTRVIVRPNRYEAGRANVVVINWSRQGTVQADLSGVLQPGDTYEVRNAQDFYAAPVVSGTYGGGSVTLPMTGLSVAQPVGNAPRRAEPTGPEFNVFVVLRTN
jgi:hypothetical protein